jgi:hypothetical protein
MVTRRVTHQTMARGAPMVGAQQSGYGPCSVTNPEYAEWQQDNPDDTRKQGTQRGADQHSRQNPDAQHQKADRFAGQQARQQANPYTSHGTDAG